jgi:hypothetical protein
MGILGTAQLAAGPVAHTHRGAEGEEGAVADAEGGWPQLRLRLFELRTTAALAYCPRGCPAAVVNAAGCNVSHNLAAPASFCTSLRSGPTTSPGHGGRAG